MKLEQVEWKHASVLERGEIYVQEASAGRRLAIDEGAGRCWLKVCGMGQVPHLSKLASRRGTLAP